MSVPPVDIAKAVANPRLLDGQSIQVNVGELRKLVARAGLVLDPMKRGTPPAAVDDLADSAGELAQRYDDAVAAELEEERRGTWAAPLWPKKKDA